MEEKKVKNTCTNCVCTACDICSTIVSIVVKKIGASSH